MLPNLGDNRVISIQSVIDARRNAPVEEKSIWNKAAHFFSNNSFQKTVSKSSLSTLKLKGVLPEDFIENQIRFSSLDYSIDALTDFGFTFEHFLEMGFEPTGFQLFSDHNYKRLGVRARDMLRTSMNIHDLVALHLTPQQLHSLGFTMEIFKSIGGTKENMKALCSANDMQLYFERSAKKVGRTPVKVKKSASKLIF